MTVLSRDLDIPLPADVVWDTLMAVESWPRWMAHVVDAGWDEGAIPEQGARLHLQLQHLQAAPRIEAEVTSFRPGREFAYRAVGGDLPFTEGMQDVEWEWRIWGRPTGISTVTFTLTYRAAGGMAFFRELLGTRLQALNLADTSLQALRAMAEGTVPTADAAQA
jgi:uncharacterized protein YndB with AHSA1/START domain